MKKRILFSFLLLNILSNCFAQQIKYLRGQSFKIDVDFQILDDGKTYVYDNITDSYISDDYTVQKDTVYKIEDYEETYGVDMLCIDGKYLVDSTNYKIANCDSFSSEIIYSNINREIGSRWIPLWYFYALEKKNRNLIAEYEPKRATWDADITPDVWYKEIPEVASLVITNTGLAFYTPLLQQIVCLFKSVNKKGEGIYEVVAYPDIRDSNNDISWKQHKENFPDIRNGNPIRLRFEIDGKKMHVYNGSTGKICMELIQMPSDWVKLYEQFIRTNVVPSSLKLPNEYLHWNENEKTISTVQDKHGIETNNLSSATNVSLKKIMSVSENLKLRAGEATSTQVLAVMQAGTKVKILELGKEETIDGINSNWVKVEVISGRDRDGKDIKKKTTGWCYGGYLE